MRWSRRSLLRRGAVAGVAGVVGCVGRGPAPAEQLRSAVPEFEELQELTTALTQGYRSRATYVETENGALGEVFVHERAHEITDPDDLDPHQPTILFAGLREDGTYDPVGVGWSIDEGDASGTPELFDRAFHAPAEHHVPGQDGHYGLHAWVFDDDVDDVFRPTHPSLTAPSFADGLAEAREAIERFQTTAEHDGSAAAEEAGYRNTEEHIFTDDGLYGVPFYNEDVDGLEIKDPPILLYRMTDMWYYELLGVEWYVPADQVETAPELLGQSFHDPLAGHSPHTDQPEHFGLHAWLTRANPDGMFALYNPQFE